MAAGAEEFVVVVEGDSAGFVDGGGLVDVWPVVSCAVAELAEVFGVKFMKGNFFLVGWMWSMTVRLVVCWKFFGSLIHRNVRFFRHCPFNSFLSIDCSGQAIPCLSRLRRPLFVDGWAEYLATKGSVSVIGDVSSHIQVFDCRPRLAPFQPLKH